MATSLICRRLSTTSERATILTPTAGSNFSRYIIPDEVNPSGICCICVPVPDDVQWRAQFMGALYRMSKQTHYERDAAHSGRVVAAKWREVWAEVQDMGRCCDDAITGAVNVTNVNVQIQTYLATLNAIYVAAGSDIDVAWPNTPDNFDTDPGDVGGEIAQRNRALCFAVESWVDELLNRGIALARDAGLEISASVTAGIVIPLVPAWLVIGGFVAAAFALSELVVEMADGDYRAYLKCAMVDALKGADTNTPTEFAEAWDNLPSRPPPPENLAQDLARDAIEAWGRSQLNNVDNYLGFITTLNTAMSAAVSLTDDDCKCLGVVLEINAGIPFTTPMVLEDLGLGSWRATSGVWEHPTWGTSAIAAVVRIGGGCFDIENAVLISGSVDVTSWTPCGGGTASNPGAAPQDRPNIEAYAVQNQSDPPIFVVEFDATLP